MWYQSCDDQDPLCLPLQYSVIRETFIWSVGYDCHIPVGTHDQHREKKISASSEQHKVHDLHKST